MTRFSHYFVIALLSIMSTDLLAEVRSGNLECQFYLFGEISMADADALATSDCGFALLSLANSPGGDVHAAMVIGRWLRERNATVNVQIDSFCYSSCALVYISGISRANFGEIGLHRPYLVGLPRSQNEVRIAVERMHTQLIAYVAEMGVRPEFSSAMINTPPDQMKI